MQKGRISAIIVTWNTKGLLKRCLEALYENTSKDLLKEVIIVDNASNDGTVEFIRKNYPNIKLILNGDNLGFGKSNNKAIRIAEGDYLLFLNTDIILTKGAIDRLMDFMESHPDTGLCSPQLINGDGSPQESYITFPSLTTELFGRLGEKKPIGPKEVHSVRGACMLARKSAVCNAGGFNEKYFMFLEETDLCLRLNKKGYKIWLVPDSLVYHTGGGSASKRPVDARIEYWKSRYIFFKENYSSFYCYALNFGLFTKLAIDWVLNLIAILCTLLLNKKFKRKFKVYSMLILWHILGKPFDWGIDSGNIVDIGGWFVRMGFVDWWNRNRDMILNGSINSKTIKENSSRKLSIYNGEVYVKIYKKRFIFRKPWMKEWRLINKLRQMDIATVMPIACRHGCLITKRMERVMPLQDFILKNKGDIRMDERISFTKKFAEFVKKFHIKGILHGDLHAGNILIKKQNGNFEFYVTDLHRARIKIGLSRRDIINNLVQLDKLFSIEVNKSDRLRFLKYYAAGTVDYASYAKKIYKKTKNACYKLWRKRDHLYLNKDKYGLNGRHQGISYIINPKYKNININEILGDIKEGHGEIIKDSRSSYLSKFNISGIGDVVLKIYKQKRFINYLKDIFRRSRGLKSWRGSWALITRRISTIEPILAGEIRRFRILKKSFFVSKYIPDAQNLTMCSRDPNFKEGPDFINNLSIYIRTLHDRGVFPEDMKGSNIIVKKTADKIEFYLIDLDHIHLRKEVSLKERFYNLQQIKNSTGLILSRALPIKRILIVKPSSMGDIVQSLPVALVIREAFPGAGIWWFANRNYAELLKCVPGIDKVVVFEREQWKEKYNILSNTLNFISLIRDIRAKRFGLVFDMQGLFRTGIISLFSGAPLRIGFGDAREFAGLFYTYKVYPKKEHAKERYLELVNSVVPLTGDILNLLKIPDGLNGWADNIWGDWGKRQFRIVLGPGGRWQTKRWPADKYVDLVNELVKKYHAKIILIGDENDIDTADTIMERINDKAINLTSKTSLVELAAIIKECDIFITNDSGPMHLADYLNKSIAAIFGPTDPFKTGPSGRKAKIVKSKLPCSPCFKKYCRNFLCMEGISINDIVDAVEDLLNPNFALHKYHTKAL